MTFQKFLNNQTAEAQKVFKTLDTLIKKHDKTVVMEVGSIMSIKEALVYKQDQVFKYGVTITKNHFSFHSMVMYAYPHTLEKFKQGATGIMFQKGCINFKSLDVLNLLNFEAFLKDTAVQDFTPVIQRYKNKKK